MADNVGYMDPCESIYGVVAIRLVYFYTELFNTYNHSFNKKITKNMVISKYNSRNLC